MPPVDVESIVVRARRGDPRALEGLVRELALRLGPVCGSIALDDGDDALQEALMVVVQKLHQLREPAAVVGWARRIAVREALRVARRRERHTPVGHEIDGGMPSIDPDVDLGLDVRATLATLSPDHRAVLVLRHVEGLSEDETAELLAWPQGTVKSRGHRARAAFLRRWPA